jgi:uncharacterized membrane protein (DUF2068 family)
MITQLLTWAAGMLVFLAHLWEIEGYGLNPWIALPWATALILTPYVIFYSITVDEHKQPKEDLSCIQLKNRQTSRW